MMKLQFLSSNHQLWLRTHPEAATQLWHRYHNETQELIEDGREQQAINCAGSAVEAAQIAMSCHLHPFAEDIQLYIESNTSLVRLLCGAQKPQMAKAFLLRAIVLLESLLLTNINRHHILNCRQNLKRLGNTMLPTVS